MSLNSEVLINKQNLLHNLRQFKKIAMPSLIMAVVKSNAYGHGLVLTAKALESETDWFATVNLDEALVLRKSGIKKPILVLSYYDLSQSSEAITKKVSLVVYDLKQAQALNKTAKKLNTKARVHLKIDTGTSRLGVLNPELLNFASQLVNLKNLQIEGIFSHFASSEESAHYTQQQINLFELSILELSKLGIEPKIKHIACTAAALTLKNSHYNAVRVGIGLYGLWPSETTRIETQKLYHKIELKPALSWKTRIIQVKKLKKGTSVGYGNTYRTKKDTLLAVLPVGYYEGYDRRLSNNSQVLIASKRCNILGRICMNLMMVDVTGLKVETGDEAILIGKLGKEEITADQLAKRIGTINYEVVTRINPLISRVVT